MPAMLQALLALAILGADSPKTFITAASGVRPRATAAANGAEVARLPICTVLKELEPPGAKVTVAGQDGVWEQLAALCGRPPGPRASWASTSIVSSLASPKANIRCCRLST
jgi:hypothetical protein